MKVQLAQKGDRQRKGKKRKRKEKEGVKGMKDR
jgi:hypothetical protein